METEQEQQEQKPNFWDLVSKMMMKSVKIGMIVVAIAIILMLIVFAFKFWL